MIIQHRTVEGLQLGGLACIIEVGHAIIGPEVYATS